jgi:RNA polymerase sigma factor (sigma-70 family)
MTDSHTLLASYARTGSESAFRELVSRYLDLVYSTAYRLVGGDAQSAQDVAQTVFLALANKAGTLPKDAMLGGWLHQHTRFVAGELMRTERRRQLRERQAAEMNAIEDHTQSNLAQVAPVLDEAIGQLDAEDRTAILLRFFERKDFRSVGEALGSSEEAARKRVDRALEKLHVLLKHRGATLSAAALGTALATEAVTAAPAGLAGSVAATALSSAAAAGGITAALVKIMTMTKLKLGLTALVIAGAATTLVIQHQSQTKLREENESFRQQNAQLKADTESLSSVAAQAKTPVSLPSDQLAELLRLRGEVGMLRQQSNELARFRQENRKLLSQVSDTTDPDVTYVRQRMRDAKTLIAALYEYADKHNQQFPTSFDQAVPYLGRALRNGLNAGERLRDLEDFVQVTNQFDIVYQGKLNAITNGNDAIVLREKQATQSPQGKWVKTYGFADGHSESLPEPEGGFEAWEQ